MISRIRIQGYRIFRDFELEPDPKINLIVGPNESGKSTLIEAVGLALSGRVGGRYAAEELNPYWFNMELVDEFLADRAGGGTHAWPEILIELFLEDRDALQKLCGANNSSVPTKACPGVSLRVAPNSDYSEELDVWLAAPEALLPVEFYRVEWRTFADEVITNRPRLLSTATIDSRTIRSSSGVDYHLRNILRDGLSRQERAAISLSYRKVKSSMSGGALKSVNDRMASVGAALHDEPISLAMDQSARTSWEGAVTPHVNDVPFSMSGQGQQAAIKIALAMDESADRASFVLVEEPENYLTHTSLARLVSRMERLRGDDQQLFITTHSSFVANRFGLSGVHLLTKSSAGRLSDLSEETERYFQKLPGYDTLRIVLASKVVLVEGPSDEIIFERLFRDAHSAEPMDVGIDVISVGGLAFRRCLELCALLDKPAAALRDNDGQEPTEIETPLADLLCSGKREVFIGAPEDGRTLEPQLIHFNDRDTLRSILGLSNRADLEKWMNRKKTEASIRIAESDECVVAPEYIAAAIDFIHG